jgi:hypothetical protein
MDITVKWDVKRLTKDLSNIQRKQIPFATMLAMNKGMKGSTLILKKRAAQHFDRPQSFTLRAFGFKAARKRTLIGKVFIKKIQNRWLGINVSGGTVTHGKKHGAGVPFQPNKHLIPLDAHGNIRGRRKGLIKRKKQFIRRLNKSTTTKGVFEVTKRYKKATKNSPAVKAEIKLEIPFQRVTKYGFRKKLFPFHAIAKRAFVKSFNFHFPKELQRALRSAK